VLLREAEAQLFVAPDRARDIALRAYRLSRTTGEAAPIAAAADIVAQASYLAADYRVSRRFAAAAYRIYRRAGDRSAACTILAVLSGSALRLGRVKAALAYAERAYAQAQEIGEPLLLATALGNLSQALTAWGRFEEAAECAAASIDLMEDHRLTGSRNYVIALNTLGLIHTHLNQDAKAEERFNRALTIATAAGDTAMQSMLKSNLALLCWRFRDWEKGMPLFEEALAIARGSGDEPREAEISLNVARGLIELGRLEEAMPMLVRAFFLARRGGNRELEFLVVTAESRLFERQNRPDEAARSAEQALAIATTFESDAYRMVAMHTYARSCIRVGKLEQAAELLEQVCEIEESLSRELRADAMLTSMFDVQVTAYEDLQWVQVQLGRYPEALVSAERGRARVLARQLAERDAQKESPPDLDEIRQLASEWKTTFLVISLVRDPTDVFDTEPEAHAFVWAVPPDPAMPVAFHRSPSLRDWAMRPAGTVSRDKMDAGMTDAGLRAMYDWFIAPVAHALPADPSAVVTIVPTGPLAVMPLAAACDADGVFFIERHPIAMTPSIQTLRLARRRESRAEGAVVIGDPESDLVWARSEAEFIANGTRTSALMREAATHEAVTQAMPGKWLLHFATHAVFDTGDAASYHGALLLADGRLTAEEIRAMRLDAELVVLSACDTGQGRIAADGVLGLTRSFLLAGARSVVATLWEIPDEPTRLLIEQFYERLAVHGHKARALQEAMLHVMRIPDATPYDWAAFVLIGHHAVAEHFRQEWKEGPTDSA
jgi:CHAT domain-containing protein